MHYGHVPHRAPPRAEHPGGRAAFILGLAGLLLGAPLGVPAILLGRRTRWLVEIQPERWGSAGPARAGIVLGWISVVETAAAAAFVVSNGIAVATALTVLATLGLAAFAAAMLTQLPASLAWAHRVRRAPRAIATPLVGVLLGGAVGIVHTVSVRQDAMRQCALWRDQIPKLLDADGYDLARSNVKLLGETCGAAESELVGLRATIDARQTGRAASAEAARTAQIDGARAKIASNWSSYDALPTKSKADLFATLDAVKAATTSLPPSEAAILLGDAQVAYRERMAPLVLPEARAAGPQSVILVPSPDRAKCLVWGSMWSNNDDTASSLVTLGFQQIVCPDKEWNVGALDRECYLYWTKSADHTADDVVWVWKTKEFFDKAQIMGHATGDEAAMRFLGLVSRGANTMMPGGHFTIDEREGDSLHITGREKQSGISGYVDPAACHRKALGASGVASVKGSGVPAIVGSPPPVAAGATDAPRGTPSTTTPTATSLPSESAPSGGSPAPSSPPVAQGSTNPCDPPFTIDAATGRKKYKLECIK